jgi:alanyl-tRNA synthetase
VARIGDIGQFKIVSESAVGAGIRRIIAVAGEAAVETVQDLEAQLQGVAQALKVGPDAVEKRLQQLLERNRALEKELEVLKASAAASGSDQLLEQVVVVGDVKVLAARLDGADSGSLRDAVDHLKDRLGSAVVVLASVEDEKVRLAAGVTANIKSLIKAGDLVNFIAQQVGGKGGGRPDFAQAGGNRPEALHEALGTVVVWVKERIAQ